MLSKADIREIQTQKNFKVDTKVVSSDTLYILNRNSFYLIERKENLLNIENELTLDFKQVKLQCKVSKVLKEGEEYKEAIEFFSIAPSEISAVYIVDILE